MDSLIVGLDLVALVQILPMPMVVLVRMSSRCRRFLGLADRVMLAI